MSYDGLDLINAMHDLTDSINQTIDSCQKEGLALADAERKYNILLRQKALKEKADGIPVTFITNFLKGDEEIATLRMQRDIAEVKYNTLQEKVRSLKLQLSIVNAQAGREWAVRSSDY